MQSAHPPIPVGAGTLLGVFLSLVAAGGAIAAAIQNKDTVALESGIGAALAAVSTISSRTAQAVAAIKKGVTAVAPVAEGAVLYPDAASVPVSTADEAGKDKGDASSADAKAAKAAKP